MTLRQLTLLNYKNIEEGVLNFSPKVNCLIGQNGEGKTNLLDAIYFLSFTKSAFNAIDSQIVRHDQSYMMLKGVYDSGGDIEEISCSLQVGKRKNFRRNGKDYKKISEHIGLIPLIMVSPSDSELIIGGSENRRKFIDITISQFNALYMANLTRYNKALQQKNNMLKAEEEPNAEIISIYEEILAEAGEYIFQERVKFINEFIPFFQEYYSCISGNHENVFLNYTSHCQRGPLLNTIQNNRFKERAVGYSLYGIHKDDIEMLIDSYPIKREGSQGQSKTFLIALKLAQFEFIKYSNKGKSPILLLDDIFDKLDSNRVSNIINIVSKESFGQIFITDTNREHLDVILQKTANGNYKIYKVSDGIFTEE